MVEKSGGTDFSKMLEDKTENILSTAKIREIFSSELHNFISAIREEKVMLSMSYLAPIDYFMTLTNARSAVIEQHEYYQKQTYRNRCRIAGANGVLDLIIPVEKTANNKATVRDIRISGHNDWQRQHWKAISSAYLSSPFFEYYLDDFRPFYEKNWLFLWDFNMEIQNKIFELLEIYPKLEFTDKFIDKIEENILDLRLQFHPKKQPFLKIPSYYQVFENKFGFISGLSIIDLLFNMGNESLLWLLGKAE